MDLPCVPDTIDRPTVTAFLESLGIIPEHLQRLSITATGIEATVRAVNARGNAYLVDTYRADGSIAAQDVARHTIVIPYDDL